MSDSLRRDRAASLYGLGFLAVMVAAIGGCNAIEAARSLMYHASPNEKKMDAEFAGLEKRKVVVYVWAKPETIWDYPQMRLDLAAHLSAYLKEHVEEIEIIPAPRVEAHIKTLTSMNPEPADIAKHFHADMLVHLSIYKFTMRDPGMSQFYRGRISSSVIVQDLTAKDGTVKRVPLPDVVVTVPEDSLVGYYNMTADQVRDMTYREFTQVTGRKFHEWQKELK